MESSNEASNFIFQIIDIDYFHNFDYENVDENSNGKEFVIQIFGMDKQNKTVYLEVVGFKPYFYVELEPKWSESDIENLVESIKKQSYPYENKKGLYSYEIVKKKKFWGFTENKEFKFLKLIFNDYDSMRSFTSSCTLRKHSLNEKQKGFITLKLYESNLLPILRFAHCRNIDLAGLISLPEKKIKKTTYKNTNSVHNLSINWKCVNKHDEYFIAELNILAFDIECISGDGSFPQPERDPDKVIQIGATLSKFGHSDCYEKHIVTLGTTDKIDGVNVYSYDNENELFLGFTKLINKLNPDIITGYNICGFDFNYIERRIRYLDHKFNRCDRCKLITDEIRCETCVSENNYNMSTCKTCADTDFHKCKKCNKCRIHDRFCELSRVNGDKSKFVEQKLASSSMGENILKYYAMTGRVIIDLMKVVQRDYKLSSYKLDSVASSFIKENITKITNEDNNLCRIETKNTFGLHLDNYIVICVNDGVIDEKHNDGEKFKILEFGSNYIIINGNIQLNFEYFTNKKKYKVFWCQAKDDVTPNEIFTLQRGTSQDRSIIAKYCVQDCVLCNKLITKLQIITNNISMANVCSVPLSFLFLRGQGVKIFSLVAKKCREKDYVMPVIKKKEISLDVDDGYEGAVVFIPKPDVYLSPITVLDYASLYPSAMILRNLSHEYFVNNCHYDNLPNYKYHEISYKNNDNTITKCRFAEPIDGSKGIIPEILQYLLSARKKYKKLMESEKDPFVKAILDSLQLAYKITANSLYGQTGAPTSPICMKEIAASTTAVGREMLHFSKYFIENIFSPLINLALLKSKEDFVQCMNTSFEYIPNKIKIEDGTEITINTDKDVKIPDSNFVKKEIGYEMSDLDETGYNNKSEFIDRFYDIIIKMLTGCSIDAKIIYGDTDSVFFNLNIKDNETEQILSDEKSLKIAIVFGIWASILIKTILPPPMAQEYEKVLYPFVIQGKKRYVGNLYEKNVKDFKPKSMGIELKRRDNAPIVKIFCAGIIDQILNKKSMEGAIEFTKIMLDKLISGELPLDKFVITKTLKGNALNKSQREIENLKPKKQRSYVNRTRIVHAVLADRIADRQPGNAPMSNDRIPYVYVRTEFKPDLQGDRVETPEYIINNKLQIDYLFYITNQIMKPSMKFLNLITKNGKNIFDGYIINEENKNRGIVSLLKYSDERNIEEMFYSGDYLK